MKPSVMHLAVAAGLTSGCAYVAPTESQTTGTRVGCATSPDLPRCSATNGTEDTSSVVVDTADTGAEPTMPADTGEPPTDTGVDTTPSEDTGTEMLDTGETTVPDTEPETPTVDCYESLSYIRDMEVTDLVVRPGQSSTGEDPARYYVDVTIRNTNGTDSIDGDVTVFRYPQGDSYDWFGGESSTNWRSEITPYTGVAAGDSLVVTIADSDTVPPASGDHEYLGTVSNCDESSCSTHRLYCNVTIP